MKKRARFEKYNNGVLFICESITQPSSFSAQTNARSKTDIRKILKLDYEELSKRDEDLAFADSKGRTLTMKVRCRFHPVVSPELQALIGDVLYSILKTDHDASRENMYIYLVEERKL